MKHLSTTLFLKAMLVALSAFAIVSAVSAQNGTSDDGFLIQVTYENGQTAFYPNGAGGYGWATFGTDVAAEYELDLAWARTADGDSLACTAVVNGQALAGKAAMVRRGICNFQVKAYNAAIAGASAVVVVNHGLNVGEDDNFIQNMTPTAGVPAVDVPCIYLCRAVGNPIAAAIDAGQTVKIRFVFPRMTEPVAAYHFATPFSQRRSLDNMGVTYYNRSAQTETDILLKADIIEPDGNVVSQYVAVPPITPGASVFVPFASYTPAEIKGRFDVVFSNNKYHEPYDTVHSSFLYTDHTFGTDNFKLLPNGAGPSDAAFASGGSVYRTGGLCYTGDQGGIATHATFGITNASALSVLNSINSYLLDADSDEDGQLDTYFDLLELEILAYGTHAILGNELPNEMINVPLMDVNTGLPGVSLQPNHLYYIVLEYSDDINPVSVRFSASGPVGYNNFPTTPLFLGQLFSGWSDATVVTRLQMEGFSPDNPQPALPPVAAFDAAVNDMEVTFVNNSVDATAYTWDFGDGNGSADLNPVHSFATAGIYTIRLIATNTAGSHASLHTVQIGASVPIAAGFTSNAVSGCAPLTVEFTDASTGAGLTYLWSFPGGDPAFSTLQNPVVSYSNAGTFDVSLSVSNGFSSAFTSQSDVLTVGLAPEAYFQFFNTSDSAVAFSNGSLYGESYAWDFGDNTTGTESDPVHTYTADGDYQVVLLVTNPCGTDSFTQTVNITLAPTAGFSADTTIGCAPFTVQFNNLSSANVSGFLWTFPGGTPPASTQPNPTVIYQLPGVYSVSLNVSAPGGFASAMNTDYVVVNASPEAVFGFTTDTTTVHFSNSSQFATAYNWDFGDGNTSTEAAPTHTYTSPGAYTVTLSAQNDCGTVVTTQTVVVTTGTKTILLDEQRIRVLPNPASETLRIQLDLSGENAQMILMLLDGQGRRVFMEQYSRIQSTELLVDVKNLPAGAYQLQVLCDDGVALRKVQIQH